MLTCAEVMLFNLAEKAKELLSGLSKDFPAGMGSCPFSMLVCGAQFYAHANGIVP